MSRLKIAVQKSGRLSEDTLKLFRECGIRFDNGVKKLIASSTNFHVDFLFLRDDDIPGYVEDGIADLGVVGQNVYVESASRVKEEKPLGFSKCKLSLAIPHEEDYPGVSYFENKRIATSYPGILSAYLKKQGIHAEWHKISGSVEIAPGMGLSHGILDIVSSGSTLMSNGLREVEVVMRSQATLIANRNLDDQKKKLLRDLTFRIDAVLEGRNNKYVLLNAPNDKAEDILRLIPSMRSPTVLPLASEGWSSIHSVISEDKFWESVGKLREAGAEGILVIPIEKMVR